MSRKLLIGLFICNLIPYVVGNGLLGLLPIYAEKELGTNSAQMGFSLAIGFASLAAGTMMSGWLSRRYQIHKIFIALSVPLTVASTYLMGQASNIWTLTIFFVLSEFMIGIQLTMTSILAGKHAPGDKRGRIFGILGAALALGQLLGGLGAGPIVDRWGFEVLFTVCAVVYTLPLFASMLLNEVKSGRGTETTPAKVAPISLAVLLLLLASTLAFVANFVTSLGRPVAMSTLDFDPTAISSVIAISGAVSLPLPFVLGWLSDRFGRTAILFVCFLAGSAGVEVLVLSTDLWHFWLSQILTSVLGAGLGVSAAWITDRVSAGDLSTNLARLSATPWIGAVVGFSITGIALQNLGTALTFAIGAALPLIAALLVTVIDLVPVAVTLKRAAPGRM